MSLAQQLLNWPPEVARPVHAALFVPAADMHPQQRARAVPSALQALSPQTLSKALDASRGRDALLTFDGRQLGHRLALLPAAVIDRLCLNLGALLHAPALRKVVMRSQREQLAQAGLDDALWSLVFSAPSAHHEPPPGPARHPATDLARDLTQWPAQLHDAGAQALHGLADALPAALGQRLRWKLPERAGSPTLAPAAALEQAYLASVQGWCSPWDACLQQATAPN